MHPRWSVLRRLSLVPIVVLLELAITSTAYAASPALQFVRTIQTSPFASPNPPVSMKDAEGSAYVPQDNSIWLADDNGHAIYEVDPASGALKRVIPGSAFEATTLCCTPGGPSAGSTRDRDIESMAYDAVNDVLYVFSGKCCDSSVRPTAFRLSRVSGQFQLDYYQPLPTGSDYTASAWNPDDGKVYVGVRKELRTYDFDSNVSGSIFRVPNLTGILGMGFGFSADGALKLWVARHDAVVSRVDWASGTLDPGWTFSVSGFGLRDSRAVEQIDGQLYVLDGYDGRPKGDPLRHALYVFNVVS
jgi:DNA-binding beta-propeller fold protein YncE